MAASAAFSSGSPTSSPSSSAREWHDASTHCTSNDTSFTGVSRCFEEGEGRRGGRGGGGGGGRGTVRVCVCVCDAAYTTSYDKHIT